MRTSLILLSVSATLGLLWFGISRQDINQSYSSSINNPVSLKNKIQNTTSESNSSDKNLRSTLTQSSQKLTGKSELNHRTLINKIYALIETDHEMAARLLKDSPLDERQALTLSLVKSWSQFDPLAALEWFQQLEHTLSDSEFRIGHRAILKNFALVDPQSAYDHVSTLVNMDLKNELLFDVATGWASIDPAAALDWANSLSALEPEVVEAAYSVAMEAYLEVNPEEAIDALEGIESEALKAQLVPQAASIIANHDLDRSLSWIGEFKQSHIRQAGIAAVAQSALDQKKSHDRVLDILLNEPSLYKDEAYEMVETLKLLAYKSPELVLSRFEQIPSAVGAEVTTVLSQGSLRKGTDIEAYGEWLRNLPTGGIRDAGVLALAQHNTREEPNKAIQWAQELSKPEERISVISEIIRSSSSDKLPDISSRLADLNIPPEEYTALESVLLKRL